MAGYVHTQRGRWHLVFLGLALVLGAGAWWIRERSAMALPWG